jgi:hypothetical protein
MQIPDCHKNYPATTVIASNPVSFLNYGIGIYILFRFGLIRVIGNVLFILLLEFRLPGGHCMDCYYYGRTGAFGKGYLSSLF